MKLWHDAHTDCYIAKTDEGDVLGVFTTRSAAAKAIARHLNGEPPCAGCGPVAKEAAGHPFRGNQYTGGRPGAGGSAPKRVSLKGGRRGLYDNESPRPANTKRKTTGVTSIAPKAFDLKESDAASMASALGVELPKKRSSRKGRLKAALARAAQSLQHPNVVRASGYASGAVDVARQFAHVEGQKPQITTKKKRKAARKAKIKALARKYGFGTEGMAPPVRGGDPTALAGWLTVEGKAVRKGEGPGHPFRGNQYTGGRSGGGGGRKPARDLSPSMLLRRTNGMAKRLGLLMSAGLDTEGMYSVPGENGGRVYTPERERLHREIVDALMEQGRATAKKQGRVLLMGGLPGSGKSTMVKSDEAKAAGINEDDFITINPDDIKEIMIDKGMLPDVARDPRFKTVKSLKPRELVSLIHEESSKIAFDLADRVQREGYNIIWDITMSGTSQVQKRLAPLQDGSGPMYSEVIMMFQDVSPATSKKRANDRYVGMDTKDPEKGGRFVPGFVIDGSIPDGWSEYDSTNREAFEQSKGQATHWELWNNDVDGVPARRVATGGSGAKSGQAFLEGTRR